MNFTLEDSTTDKISPLLGEIVQRIVSHSNSSDSIQKDFIFVLILVLMIENGFYPVNSDLESCDVKSIGVRQLKKWKSPNGLMVALFIMSGCETFPLKLIMSPMGSTALVNVILSDLNAETYSVCLPISRYVVSPQASTIPMIFRDLKHLSFTFKNKILSPVKSRILSYCGYASASLVGLPEEVLYNMFLYLPICDVVNASQTCKRLKFLIESDCLWHELYKRDFDEGSSDKSDWKELYKDKYKEQQDLKTQQVQHGAGTMHDYMDYSDYISYIDNPMWNII